MPTADNQRAAQAGEDLSGLGQLTLQLHDRPREGIRGRTTLDAEETFRRLDQLP